MRRTFEMPVPADVEVERGSYRVIRVDGSEELIRECPTIDGIHDAIGCDMVDTVTLDRDKEIVMLVDDVGLIDGKPVNQRATELARRVYGPGYKHQIHGDVAIVNDRDFGDDD